MQTTIQPFVDLKDLSFNPYAVVAYGKGIIPQTMQTPEMPTLTVWLRDVPQPLIITYATEQERDAEFEAIKTAVNSL
jgi:hypothetical protein